MAKIGTDRNETNKNMGFILNMAASTNKSSKDASSRPDQMFSSGNYSRGEMIIRIIEVIKAL